MSDIKKCKQDLETIKNFDQRLIRLIKDVSEKGAEIQSQYQQSDDEELAVIAEMLTGLCSDLKQVRKKTDEYSKITSLLRSRFKKLKFAKPSFFQRLFSRKQVRAARSAA
tara:strand:+ start:1529 stop:1858 length:330 start_codon:yes stop_codon:yes gene_type:complete